MTDESPSARALIAAYRACARPSAAAEAQLWATLAAAERDGPRGREDRPSRAPWLALAAGLLLLAAWQLDLARMFVPGQVLQDMRHQAEYDAAGPDSQDARIRADGEGGPREAGTPELEGQKLVVTPPRERAAGQGRGAQAGARGRAASRAESGTGAAEAAEGGDEAVAEGDRMLAEMALLQQARAALRGGQPGAALAVLERHAEEFADCCMLEERQALRVQALCAAGEAARGAVEAAAFLRAHPRSTYAGRVASACPEGHAPKDRSKDL
ncbi:hypothetical protein [Nannocystis bainbridge]|uniref:Uncharacterized protein n=1 Tax=Nannocystis bainbridge TaxID=2995303 RepID=A0ABT5DUI9_9BACT|nr:hypothetical protein [Nannocystis bainbridge]MDC0716709.1 hypothetical protein [Nannocystis bainbridge]